MAEISALFCQERITEEKAAQRAGSVFAAIALARTNQLRKKLCEKGERLNTKNLRVLTACCAVVVGTTTSRTSVLRIGTTTTRTTGTTTSASVLSAPELCGVQR